VKHPLIPVSGCPRPREGTRDVVCAEGLHQQRNHQRALRQPGQEREGPRLRPAAAGRSYCGQEGRHEARGTGRCAQGAWVQGRASLQVLSVASHLYIYSNVEHALNAFTAPSLLYPTVGEPDPSTPRTSSSFDDLADAHARTSRGVHLRTTRVVSLSHNLACAIVNSLGLNLGRSLNSVLYWCVRVGALSVSTS
jgi:hypothetical protein